MVTIASVVFERSRLVINVKDSVTLSFKVKKSISIVSRTELTDETRTRAFCRVTIDGARIIEIDREGSEYGIIRTSCSTHEVQFNVQPYKITFLIHEILKLAGDRLGFAIEKKLDGISRTYDIVMFDESGGIS